ncbi:MAG: LTA synthase family protein [Zoogloeaceae bacterium]|nr:LTA synthase family protein [Zoogloeaceae bacterium]
MSLSSYPRLRYLLAGTTILFTLFALLRAGFYFGASEVSLREDDAHSILETLGVGLRFDLRLALLLMLPSAFLLILPRWNAQKTPWLRGCLRAWLLAALLTVGLIYIVDFGYYAWLGLRLNASALRFLGDPWISARLVWENYPVVPIAAALLVNVVLFSFLFLRVEKATLDRPPRAQPRWQAVFTILLCTVGGSLGLLGRVSHINPANPVPLRWNDAFLSGNTRVGALGLNPVLFIWDTWRTSSDRYDLAYVREHAEGIAAYLGAPTPVPTTGEELPVFAREIPVQPHRLSLQKPPNVVFIMLESLGGSVTGMHGNPLDPTPNLDALARRSWFLRNFYVPVTGTAKTVWASITGIPDVTRSESATRNPLLLPQHTILNAFREHDKLYAIGGSAGWANMSALIKSSVAEMSLHEEGEWKSPNINVWGISDLALFREVDVLLRNRSRERPFFAIIQTADNHPPFTIPSDNDGFMVKNLPEEALRQAGFRSNAQYNAVRLLDHSIGRFIEMAKQSGYYGDTVFVFYGDHNGRIAEIPFKSRAYAELNLESLHVPGLIHFPALISPKVTEEATSLIDLLPTVAGLLGVPYRNTTLGRDIRIPAPEGERAVPVVLREGAFPLIGVVTKTHLLHMNADGTDAGLFAVDANKVENLAAQDPVEFSRLSALARELHESARLMLYSNKIGS